MNIEHLLSYPNENDSMMEYHIIKGKLNTVTLVDHDIINNCVV